MPGVAVSLRSLEKAGALSATGLVLADPKLSRNRYEAIGALLGRSYKTLQFAIGDWLLLGEALYGEESYQYSEVLDMSPEGRTQYLRVALAIAPGRRRSELSWSHHRTVSPLEPRDQDFWLERAIEKGWSNRELGEQIRDALGPATVGRGSAAAKANQETPGFPRPYVVEAVEEAAREVCLRASWDGADFRVPGDSLQALATSLGVPLSGDEAPEENKEEKDGGQEDHQT